ncbi:hypothetical protein BC567DRAFT_237112 [Phyllosticta citribraziliensis]
MSRLSLSLSLPHLRAAAQITLVLLLGCPVVAGGHVTGTAARGFNSLSLLFWFTSLWRAGTHHRHHHHHHHHHHQAIHHI